MGGRVGLELGASGLGLGLLMGLQWKRLRQAPNQFCTAPNNFRI